VYPEGKARGMLFGAVGFAWNAGGCCPNGNKDHVDDVSYLKHVITKTLSQLALSTTPIFVIGLSNGGMMANRLVCEDTRIKAFVAVAGPLINGTENPRTETFACTRKIPVLHFHGLADGVVPFEGCNATSKSKVCQSLLWFGNGSFAPMPYVPSYIDSLRARNGVSNASPAVTFRNNTASCTSWGDIGSNVTFCTFQNMGHAWPGICHGAERVMKFMMNCSLDMDASFHAMDFLRRYMIPSTSIVV
jgi:polyhydroxybutyrate depolymerase